MKKIVLLILILWPAVNLSAESRITREKWHQTIEDADYSEHYKELRPNRKYSSDGTEHINANQKDTDRSRKTSTIILIILISLLLAGLIVLLLNNSSVTAEDKGIKKKRSVQISDAEDPGNFNERELDRYLTDALQQNNFRLAIRIHFLIIMKSLKEKGLITWKKDKTNFDYLLELSRHESIESFRKVVREFEKAWYAEYELNREQYKKLSVDFTKLRLKLEK